MRAWRFADRLLPVLSVYGGTASPSKPDEIGRAYTPPYETVKAVKRSSGYRGIEPAQNSWQRRQEP